MELLILMALACWGGTRYAVHTPLRIAERRQRADQAHQLRMARMAKQTGPTLGQAITARIARRIENPRGGPARQAIALWWADSWAYATDRRMRRHERAEQGDLRRQRAARSATRWITEQWSDFTGRAQGNAQADGKAGDGQERVRAESSVNPTAADADDVVDAELVDDEPTSTDSSPPAGRSDQTNDESAASGSSDSVQHEASQPGASSTRHAQHDPDDSMASVHPLNTHRKEPTMSTPTSTTVSSGETLDPNAARRFVGEVEDVARQLLSQVELSLSSLQGSGVAGEPLTHLVGIQEALGGVVSQAHAAASHFNRHIGTGSL